VSVGEKYVTDVIGVRCVDGEKIARKFARVSL